MLHRNNIINIWSKSIFYYILENSRSLQKAYQWMPDDGKRGKRQMAGIVEDGKALQTEGMLPALLVLMTRLWRCQNF